MTDPPPEAPLEAIDPTRARIVRRKVLDRLKDIRRHYRALTDVMAEFGADFDLDDFAAASRSEDPGELNAVKAAERGLDTLYNYIAELTALGLELARRRDRGEEPNAARDLRRLRDCDVISGQRCDRLQRVREIRRLMVHEYTDASAEQVHEAVVALVAELPGFIDSYRRWVRSGFAVATDGEPG